MNHLDYLKTWYRSYNTHWVYYQADCPEHVLEAGLLHPNEAVKQPSEKLTQKDIDAIKPHANTFKEKYRHWAGGLPFPEANAEAERLHRTVNKLDAIKKTREFFDIAYPERRLKRSSTSFAIPEIEGLVPVTQITRCVNEMSNEISSSMVTYERQQPKEQRLYTLLAEIWEKEKTPEVHQECIRLSSLYFGTEEANDEAAIPIKSGLINSKDFTTFKGLTILIGIEEDNAITSLAGNLLYPWQNGGEYYSLNLKSRNILLLGPQSLLSNFAEYGYQIVYNEKIRTQKYPALFSTMPTHRRISSLCKKKLGLLLHVMPHPQNQENVSANEKQEVE
ncbi:MAG: hypothetical protein H7A37_00950 [Chlamydiales bacterium]|nr:hypothetical protein [Chlamydiales bacterium]